MRRAPTAGKSLAWLLLLATVALPAQARTAVASIAQVRSEAATLDGVTLTLTWPDGADTGTLDLRAERLAVPALALDARDLRWGCPLRRDGDGQWACEGPVRAGRGPARTLAVALSAAGNRLSLTEGKARAALETRAAAPDQLALQLQAVPVDWLRAFLAQAWAEARWTDGRVSGTATVGLPADGAVLARGRLDIAGLGLETPDGSLAAAGVAAGVEFDYASRGSLDRARVDLALQGGEWLAGNLYVPLPAHEVKVGLQLEHRAGQGWRLPSLSWRDPGALDLDGSAALAEDGSLQALSLAFSLPALAVAKERYLSGFLAPAGFPNLVLGGALSGRLAIEAGALRSLDLAFDGANAVDPRQRFVLAGLDGSLAWRAGEQAATSAMRWQSGALYGIGLGAGRFEFSSAGRELRLTAPARFPVLDGRLSLDHLRWQAPDASQGARFQLGATLEALDLGSLSQRLGWPPFTGSLGGRIPSARYEKGVLVLDGGLAMDVFSGQVAISDLVMERPFGVAPTLSADVAIRGVDLEPMTAAFGFGAITGRLDGNIRDLRMVDWSPVAFDAMLRTDEAWKGKRRISQRAVEDISKVGGSGLVAGLQTQVLKIFDDFGYARIGLGCRLRDNVCAMQGVGSAGDGYTIVEGAGLPRIQVVGFRRRVDWPTLVARLEAATEGQVPVIQ